MATQGVKVSSLRLLRLGLVTVAVLITGPAAADAALVPSPQEGKVYPAGRSVLLRVSAGPRDDVRVRLNGTLLRHELDPLHRGRHRIWLSPSHGLRHGANVARVVVRPFHGARKDRFVRFTVARDGPLAAAGHDLAAAPGARVRFDGTDSRPHPSGGAHLEYRWALAGAPDGSAAPKRGTAPTVRGARSAHPTFRPDVEGAYRFRLRVRTPDGSRGVDRVTLRTDPPPLLDIETMAEEDGEWGIRVGDQHYPATAGQWLQVVVLDRSLGTLRSNKSYPCPDLSHDALEQCVQAVQQDLDKVGEDALVIASNQPEGGGTTAAPNAAAQALARLRPPFQHSPASAAELKRGTYSAIGVVEGPTTANSGSENTAGAGAIDGVLLRNNRLNYAFTTPEHVGFDTQAEGSDATSNVIRVAGQDFTETVNSAPGGFQVVVVDAATLEGTSHWFATGGKTGQAALDVIKEMGDVLRAATTAGFTLVFVASRGKPTLDPMAYDGLADSHDLFRAIRDTATALTDLGGTRGEFFDLIDPELYHNTSYTLIGSPSSAAHGAAAVGHGAGGGAGSLNELPLGGTLTRTAADYVFEVGQSFNGVPIPTHSIRNPGQRLIDTVLGLGEPWPDEGNPGREAAIALIGNDPSVGLSSDPRSQFYSHPFTASFWQTKQGIIESLQAGQLPAGVTQADFDWAKQELVTEIGWLVDAHSYIETLAAPYAQTALQSWADLGAVAAEINTDVKAAPEDKVGLIAGAIFDGVRELAGALPVVGEAFEAVNAVYDAALEVTEIADSGESPQDEFETTVAKAGDDLADRLRDAQDTLTRGYADVVASDYGKLRTVAACGSNVVAECPEDPDEWQITQDDQVHTGEGLRASLRNTFYGSLLPAKYKLWAIPEAAYPREAKYWIGHGIGGLGDFPPFAASAATGQVASPVCRDMNDHLRDKWQVYALGSLSGDGLVGNRWEMSVPGASLTNPLFEPVDSNTFPEGPLGNEREIFYLRNFEPETLEHFPLRDSAGDWEHPDGPPVHPNCAE